MLVMTKLLAVLLRGFQRGQVCIRCEVQLEDPAVFIRRVVHQGRIAPEGFINGGHCAGGGGVDVAGCFYGLDDANLLSSFDRRAHLWELDVDDVREFVLGVVCDSDGGGTAVAAEPFV